MTPMHPGTYSRAQNPGRKGRPWERVRLQVLARDRNICWICHRPGANSADHIVPISLGGRPLDPANLRAAHQSCNSSRGNGRGKRMNHSRQW